MAVQSVGLTSDRFTGIRSPGQHAPQSGSPACSPRLKHHRGRQRALTVCLAHYKAVQLTSYGDDPTFSNVEVVDQDYQSDALRAQAKAKDAVYVELFLRAVNPADLSMIRGKMGQSRAVPFTLGSEGVGRISDFTDSRSRSSSERLKKGDRVVLVPDAKWSPIFNCGTWQQFIIAPSKNVVALEDPPTGKPLDDEAAAQLTVNPLTAVCLTRVLEADLKVWKPQRFDPEGSWALLTAPQSVLARLLAGLLRFELPGPSDPPSGRPLPCVNRKTLALARDDPEKQALLASGEYDAVVALDQADPLQEIKDITGGRAVAALDAVGGSTARTALSALAPGGAMVLYGALGSHDLNLRSFDFFSKKRVEGFLLQPYLGSLAASRMRRLVENTHAYLREGYLKLPGGTQRFALTDAQAALQAAAQKGRTGKVLLEG